MSKTIHGCRDCKHKKGDLFNFRNDPITRITCMRRHAVVDVETMSKYCELYEFDPNYKELDATPNNSV